ncbi:hypothetical protein PTTG_03052 [Puccinia triticina 1-1 BBBD Race 1]|uniref:Uncharacterized protein n=1 Tax=Puccinia triticina (isolate 1-1 / race 1 (BBBD)) TaxID=630390 RepID=A0A0C4EQJ3_PUCT1|nr:hypothetical protein PTTG_03052 [Puccinia triticina 1-1 BBBD Race 1]
MIPPPLDPKQIQILALCQCYHRQQHQVPKQVYIRAHRTAFKRPSRWEPWNNNRMVLHNLLNQRGTLYLQDWDKRTAEESRRGAIIPRVIHRAEERNEAHIPSMWTRRDTIRDLLCL